MSQAIVRVTTPSRLHFGMLSFGHADVRQFGGAGLMLAEPGIRLSITAADRIDAIGPLAERAADFAKRVLAAMPPPRPAGCRIEIGSAPREHIGLGTGTQLGLAIAAGIDALVSATAMAATTTTTAAMPFELARRAGRGRRSSIGTLGFAVGGLLVEAGKRTAEEESPLVARAELPAAWRFLLLLPKRASGLFGAAEREAFARIPPVPTAVTDALSRELLLYLLPAVAAADFAEFGRSLHRYGQLAGACFAPVQAGPFLDRRTAAVAATIGDLGVAGVGQSSWGPLLFAAVPNEAAGHDLAAQLAAATDLSDYDMRVARPDNAGARIEIIPRL